MPKSAKKSTNKTESKQLFWNFTV